MTKKRDRRDGYRKVFARFIVRSGLGRSRFPTKQSSYIYQIVILKSIKKPVSFLGLLAKRMRKKNESFIVH